MKNNCELTTIDVISTYYSVQSAFFFTNLRTQFAGNFSIRQEKNPGNKKILFSLVENFISAIKFIKCGLYLHGYLECMDMNETKLLISQRTRQGLLYKTISHELIGYDRFFIDVWTKKMDFTLYLKLFMIFINKNVHTHIKNYNNIITTVKIA